MQIKQPMLLQQMQKKIHPLYVLIGQEPYLLDESVNTIKSLIKKSYDCDERSLSIQSEGDWMLFAEEANSYSLFSPTVLLDVFYDKKSMDSSGKKTLIEYLKQVNTRCFILIRAPKISAKQLQWLYTHEEVALVIAYPLNADSMKQWIARQFNKNALAFEPEVPGLIHQYTQGNLLACAQVIEKITLASLREAPINAKQALEHLSDQCTYTLFELVDACLLGQTGKAIHILRQAANNKTEATLVLWMLTQEVRILSQLSFGLQQKKEWKTVCNQLKIWPQRTSLYQTAIKRFKNPFWYQLVQNCQLIDNQIKSNANGNVWHALEKLALCLAHGNV